MVNLLISFIYSNNTVQVRWKINFNIEEHVERIVTVEVKENPKFEGVQRILHIDLCQQWALQIVMGFSKLGLEIPWKSLIVAINILFYLIRTILRMSNIF